MDGWLQLGTSTLYEKEILPTGKLTRWVGDDKNVQHATIDRSFLDRIVSNFKQFKSVGVRVPIFKTHIEDPTNKRGSVEDVFIKKNSSGQDSLFMRAAFDDEEAVKLALSNEVSVLVPPKFVDGRGNAYAWPLRHVAITATPVLPGLEPWSGPMVLAFESSGVNIQDDGNGGIDVDAYLNSLAAELELSFDESDNAETKGKKVLEAIQTLKGEKETLGLSLQAFSDENENQEALMLSYPKVLVKQFKNSRAQIVDALVLDRTISSAMGEKLKKQYCSDEALRLDLSLDSEETEFDRKIEFAKELVKDRPIGGAGGQQRKALELGRPSGDGKNPLVEGARKRAEAAKTAQERNRR